MPGGPTDVVNHREHKQAIVANYRGGVPPAYHMRLIIQALADAGIAIFPIHDSVVFDIECIRVVRRVVTDEFNKIYRDPEGHFVSFKVPSMVALSW